MKNVYLELLKDNKHSFNDYEGLIDEVKDVEETEFVQFGIEKDLPAYLIEDLGWARLIIRDAITETI